METSATIVEAAFLPHRTWRLPLLWREIWGPFQLFISGLRESKYASDLGNWYLGSGATFATASGIDVMLYEVSHRYGSHLYLSFLLMFSFPFLKLSCDENQCFCWDGENRTHMRPITLSAPYQSEEIHPNVYYVISWTFIEVVQLFCDVFVCKGRHLLRTFFA